MPSNGRAWIGTLVSGRLTDYIAQTPDYPLWWSELAALDRAHSEVLHAPGGVPLLRRDVTLEKP